MDAVQRFYKEQNKIIVLVLACFLGACIFIATYGFEVLIPTNTSWLLVGGDLSQHFIGWEFYRQSGWAFPIGIASDLAYPHGLAITFMDSIPLVAIPMKFIAPILPTEFQYFGLWGIFSYIAIAGITARIVQKWTSDWIIILTSAIFFCISPVVLQRMFSHTALAGHWIILLGIYALVCGREWSFVKSVSVWSIVLSASVLIHPYFLVMNVFIMAIAVMVRYETLRRSIAEFVLPLLSAVIASWAIGVFTISTVAGMNFGAAGYDLLSFINSNGWSAANILSVPTHYESFGYFGLGGLLLFTVGAVYVFIKRRVVIKLVKKHKYKAVFVALTFILMLLFTLGPTIRAGGIVIFEYEIPTIMEKGWSIFRVTARTAWPLFYLVMLAGVYIVIKQSKLAMPARIILGAICLIQIIDIYGSPQMQAKRATFSNVSDKKYITTLADPYWQELAKNRQHVVYLGDLYENNFTSIADFCLRNNLTLNTGYFARKPTKSIEATIKEASNDLERGSIDPKTIYITREPYKLSASLQQRTLDGYTIIFK